jgi:hypothetical protein
MNWPIANCKRHSKGEVSSNRCMQAQWQWGQTLSTAIPATNSRGSQTPKNERRTVLQNVVIPTLTRRVRDRRRLSRREYSPASGLAASGALKPTKEENGYALLQRGNSTNAIAASYKERLPKFYHK